MDMEVLESLESVEELEAKPGDVIDSELDMDTEAKSDG